MELYDAVIYGFPYKLRPKPKIALFTGMVTSCLIQLNSSVATHIVTDVLFTGIFTMQHVLVLGCSKYIMTASNTNIAHNLYNNMKN